MKKLKEKRGITLIALVITIIVLLILAGVSISMLTGENGILTQAQRAKNETENAAQNEAAILDDYNNKLNNWINGGTVSIPEGLEIGSTVHYDPNGTYTADSNGVNPLSETYSGSSRNPTQLDSSTSEFNIDTWKVFDINESTGEVTLVPQSSTDSTGGYIFLSGAQGYNNGVKILNDACSALYGDSSKGITARSINITDIEGKMTSTTLQQAHSYSNNAEHQYGQQISSGYLQSDSYYPSIYAQEALRSDNNGNKITSGIGMSEQTSLIAPTDNNATDGYLLGTSLRPSQTYWYGDNSFMQGAFETKDGVNYYNLLFPDNTDTYYWVASRCVNTRSDDCFFEVSRVDEGKMDASPMATSSAYDYDNSWYGLLPVVSLSSELISGDASSGFSIE